MGRREGGQGRRCFFIKSVLPGSSGLAATYLLGSEDCHPGRPSEQSHQEETGRSKVEVQQRQWRVVTLERLPMPRGRAGLLRSLRLLPQVTRISSLHCIRAWGGHSVVGWCQPGRERPEVGRDALIPRRDYCDHRRLRREWKCLLCRGTPSLSPAGAALWRKGWGEDGGVESRKGRRTVEVFPDLHLDWEGRRHW